MPFDARMFNGGSCTTDLAKLDDNEGQIIGERPCLHTATTSRIGCFISGRGFFCRSADQPKDQTSKRRRNQ